MRILKSLKAHRLLQAVIPTTTTTTTTTTTHKHILQILKKLRAQAGDAGLPARIHEHIRLSTKRGQAVYYWFIAMIMLLLLCYYTITRLYYYLMLLLLFAPYHSRINIGQVGREHGLLAFE